MQTWPKYQSMLEDLERASNMQPSFDGWNNGIWGVGVKLLDMCRFWDGIW